MPNAFVHIELNTTDPAQAKEFYSQVFDWNLEDVPMGEHGTYTLIKPGKDPNGGMMKHPMPGAPSSWLIYVGVDDIHASTKKAVSHGAKLLKDVTEIPGVGQFSILMDPTGAAFAMFQPKM
jgi:uncharacterized protein